MTQNNLWIILGVLGVSASVVTIVEPSLRFTAALGTFILIIFLILAQNYMTIDKLIRLNKDFRKGLHPKR